MAQSKTGTIESYSKMGGYEKKVELLRVDLIIYELLKGGLAETDNLCKIGKIPKRVFLEEVANAVI